MFERNTSRRVCARTCETLLNRFFVPAPPLFITILLLILSIATVVHAEDAVTPGIPVVTAQHQSLLVEIPYTDDLNGDSTLNILWGLQGTNWADAAIQSVLLPHQASPFRYTIAGLANFTEYQVKVRFNDVDGVTNGLPEQIVESLIPYNRLIHNSYTTGSLKWSAENGWGLPASQYGEFSCQTCHSRNTGNIKRIKKQIAVTDGSSDDSFPIQGNGEVTFLDVNKGTSDFGDDQRTPSDQSSNICEACHSKNKFHNYNTANNLATDHYNRDSCTGCHEHGAGFKASCGGCHPEEPDAASHDEHYNSAILGQVLSCGTCHSTSIHRNILSEVSFDAAKPSVAGGTYSDQGGDESSCYTEAGDYCSSPVYGNCDNLYCHSNGVPFDKAVAYAQPVWGGGVVNCTSCHAGGGKLTSLSGQHGDHTDTLTYNFDCADCHSATVSDRNTVNSAEQHIDLEKDVVFASGGIYNSARVCANTYCHSDGDGGAPNVAVNWSDSNTLGCTGCHNGRIGDASEMTSNAHLRLANEAWIREYPCEYCHSDTIKLDGSIRSFSKHVNEIKDIAFDPKWKIVGYPDPSYNETGQVCNNLYCHSDGTAVAPQVRDFPWTLGEHAKCDSCHGHQTDDDCSSCHPDGTPVVKVEDQWKMATPMYNSTGPGTPRANSHMRHLETEFACENCHRDTVVGSCNTAGCHDGGVPDGEMSEVGHVFANYHVNKVKDVTFKDGGSYDHATKTCSNTACHAGADPQWGDSRNGTILCLSCHGTTEADVDDFGGFNGIQAKINMTEWETSGHGRQTASGPYTSGNTPANFPGNPCWYCHDSEILHKDVTNPYRLMMHPQFEQRFDKECVYCHMEQTEEECLGCHNDPSSISVYQLSNMNVEHQGYADGDPACMTSGCHLPQVDSDDQGTACRLCHDPQTAGNAPKLDDNSIRDGLGGVSYKISEIRVGMSTLPYAVDHIEFRGDGAYLNVSCMATAEDWPPTGCHAADVHIHNTNSAVWSSAQKADVRNQYVMMGVCLQCHDDDDGDRCTTCHTWSGAPQDNPYTLGYDPGTGLNAGSSHASSSHFGFKHFEAYETSKGTVSDAGSLSEASRADVKFATTWLKDTSQNWTADELVGKAIRITSGPSLNEIRSILVNSNNSLTLSGLFSADLASGTSYNVLDTVWKGGKFCWDCHDPHGDSNIYMIQDEVAVQTDGLFGKPLQRAAVTFTRTLSGLDYAQSTGTINGICNVCHTNVDHYQNDYGDAHRSGRRCTDCHEHGFAQGHGSGKSCDSCHDNKPLPNHLGFGQPRDCTKCHDGVINKRMDIMRQFRGQSHHVQGVEVTNDHCYECHWEATSAGLIDNDYHAGYNYKTHDALLNAKSDLVVWDGTTRPDRYVLGATAVVFNAATIGTPAERVNVAEVTKHCYGCHSDQNNDNIEIFGDCKSPRQYAWDGTSIEARYNQAGVTTMGKYTAYANAAKRNQTKAYSAHGKATLNQGGWSSTTGEDGDLSGVNTRNGGQNVQCYDCHSSHGSFTTGITSSYRTFDNSFGGANLKETQAGKGGYNVTYKATAMVNGSSTMNPGATQCFDCHETASAGAMPWGYNSTYGATAPIQGYRDSSYFDGLDNGVKDRYLYRAGKTGVSGHYSHLSPDPDSPPEEQVNGLCSGCHDPHGVSPTLGDNQAYAVPLLKGTWLTSPYKEDSPQMDVRPRSSNPRIASSNVQIDRKTFGDLTNRTHITEEADQFAGLCLRCHPKESLTDVYDPVVGTKPPWKDMRRVHQSVRGWGSNNEHQFSCSKCHQPHSSGLQRLMRTNCLDWDHRGELESGGVDPGWRSDTEHYPRLYNQFQPCHQSAGAAGGTENSGNFKSQEWNTVTPW